MKCKEVMKSGIEAFREDDTVQVISMRMRDMGTGFVPICDRSGHPVGTVTDYDIVRSVCADDLLASKTPASDVMEPRPTICFESDDVHRAEELMDETGKARILICEERTNKLVGVLTLADVFRAEEEHRAVETARHIVEREYLA
jgi:CBS domain-containing protein